MTVGNVTMSSFSLSKTKFLFLISLLLLSRNGSKAAQGLQAQSILNIKLQLWVKHNRKELQSLRSTVKNDINQSMAACEEGGASYPAGERGERGLSQHHPENLA